MALRQLFALSNNNADQDLIKAGLKNIGLAGFVGKNAAPGTYELHAYLLNFPKGQSFFYTLDPGKENFDNRKAQKLTSLGHARKTPADYFQNLYRFFLTDKQSHVFLTKPENLDFLGPFRDETKDNPIYIKTESSAADLPLYIYSNVLDFDQFFHPVAEAAVWESKLELLSLFKQSIVGRGLELENFRLDTDETSITVTPTVQANFENYYVNHSDGISLFLIRQKPEDSNGDAFFTDADRSSVLSRFESWLELIRKLEPKAIGADAVELNDLNSLSYQTQNLRITPTIGVTNQAQIFLNLLDSIPAGESGLLLGIFGRWGRGKTFFWYQLKELFTERAEKVRSRKKSKKDQKPARPVREYFTAEFHAWKYQDTSAAWAYLYEVLENEFCSKPIFGQQNLLTKWINRFQLNLKRVGWFKLSFGLAALVYGFVWYFLLDLKFKWDLISWVVSFVGIGTLVSGVLYYYFYSGTAKNLIKQYFSRISYRDLLGIQAEMQKELRDLFGAWISDKDRELKRVVLFVDDIDRCNEDRIIQVIDSLKVMMDDPFISQRAIVIAAIDETVLKRAIKGKYVKMVNGDLSLSKKAKRESLDRLCREYLDKLFLNGFKLGNLSSDEKVEILKSITEKRIYSPANKNTEVDEAVVTDNIVAPSVKESQLAANHKEIKPKDGSASTNEANAEKAEHAVKPKQANALEDFEITEQEFQNILGAINHFYDATPRSLRIFYYRYLLARQIKDSLILGDRTLSEEWRSLRPKEILCYLILEYSTVKTQNELMDNIRNISPNTELIVVSILESEFTLSSALYLKLLRIVAIAVPY